MNSQILYFLHLMKIYTHEVYVKDAPFCKCIKLRMIDVVVKAYSKKLKRFLIKYLNLQSIGKWSFPEINRPQ